MEAGARMLLWSVGAVAGFDTAWVRLDAGALHATGRSCGLRPRPFWVDYELEADAGFVTRRMRVEARGADGVASLDLRNDGGGWTADGVPRPDLAGALDCDLQACPLTNTMPVRRHALHRDPGEHDLLVAFVEVPSLRVVASRQRYTHLRRDGDGAVVRYASGSFQSDITVDGDGVVLDYPQLGHRLAAAG